LQHVLKETRDGKRASSLKETKRNTRQQKVSKRKDYRVSVFCLEGEQEVEGKWRGALLLNAH